MEALKQIKGSIKVDNRSTINFDVICNQDLLSIEKVNHLIADNSVRIALTTKIEKQILKYISEDHLEK